MRDDTPFLAHHGTDNGTWHLFQILNFLSNWPVFGDLDFNHRCFTLLKRCVKAGLGGPEHSLYRIDRGAQRVDRYVDPYSFKQADVGRIIDTRNNLGDTHLLREERT